MSDHAPHTAVDKDRELEAVPPGMIGMETALGVTLEVLRHREGFSLTEIVALWSTRPAETLRWGGGRLQLGEDADLTIFDEVASWQVEPERFASRGRNCPFRGWTLRGRARMTVCGGRLTHSEGVTAWPSERFESQIT